MSKRTHGEKYSINEKYQLSFFYFVLSVQWSLKALLISRIGVISSNSFLDLIFSDLELTRFRGIRSAKGTVGVQHSWMLYCVQVLSSYVLEHNRMKDSIPVPY